MPLTLHVCCFCAPLPAAQGLPLLAWEKSYEQAGTPSSWWMFAWWVDDLCFSSTKKMLCVLGWDTCQSGRLCWSYLLEPAAQRMM